MTGKELMYAEDALGHELFLNSKLQETLGQLQDPELKACLEDAVRQGKENYQSICALL